MPTQITQRIQDCLAQAERYFRRSFAMPEVSLELRGQAAGKAWPQSNRLAFNALLYQQNSQHFLEQTVAHEVAHLLAWQLYGSAIRPHGREWQNIMLKVFGLPAQRCHNYALPPRKKTLHDYGCGCAERVHGLSTWRHGRIVRGASYLCRACGQALHSLNNSRQVLVEG